MRRFTVICALLLTAAAAGHAQTTETPVPFDSAGRILSVSEVLANRLGLTAPAWPVTGAYTEARLFQTGDSAFVIVVQRNNGTNDRYPLSAAQLAAFRAALETATNRVGRVVAEDAASLVSESARRPFVRDQMLLSAFMYGPALAAMTDDPSVGTGAYLLSVGGTFFVLSNIAKTSMITKAQNSMATDGAIRGWLLSAATLNSAGVNVSGKGAAATVLFGGIGGSIVGFQSGKSLTNSEAQAAMTGSTLAAGAALGLVGTSGLLNSDTSSSRLASASLVVGGVGGYLLGPRYPRRAGYTVTAGDISIVRLGALLGALTAVTPIADAHVSVQVGAGLATVGWIGGAVIADRIAAKPFNYSESDARMVGLGALAGALMASAVPALARSTNATFNLAMAMSGAIGGAFVGHRMMDPPRQGAAYTGPHDRDGDKAWRLDFDPQGVAMTLAKQRGNHSLMRITF